MIIGDLPFIWRLRDDPTYVRDEDDVDTLGPMPAGVPARMTFEFDWDARLGLLRQKITPELEVALEAIYRAGSENLGAVEAYRQQFIGFVSRVIAGSVNMRPSGLAGPALDIGGGAVSALIGRIDCDGIYNIDPVAEKRLGRWSYQATFPPAAWPSDWTKSFSLITLNHVLEHVADPVAVLKAAAALLAKHGTIIIAVPDCTESVALGDVSMACHQHLSYFTIDSLRNCLRAADLVELRGHMQHSAGTLFVAAYPNGAPVHQRHPEGTFGRFYARAVKVRADVEMIVDTIADAAGTSALGVYCPMRILPYLPEWLVEDVRLFDDGMRGKYLDGVSQRIEGIEDFEAKPVDTMIVASMTHEQEIVTKLAGRCKVITLREMLDV